MRHGLIGTLHRPWLALLLGAGLLASTAGSAWAQPDPRNKPGRPRQNDAKGFPAKPVIDADLAALEDELAGLIQFRGEMPPEGAGRLELLIDLRIVARWLLSRASDASPESDLQATSFLRAEELTAAARLAAEVFKNSPKPTPPQIDAMAKIHAVTFTLPELKQVKQADEICRQIGSLLAVAAGPLPPEIRQIPLMRPALLQTPTGPVGPTSRTVEIDPLSRANLLTVSAPLKKQVLALVSAVSAADAEAKADPKKADDAAAMLTTLKQVLDIGEGLSRNTAIDPQSRPRVEQQLAEGLALYTDPRLRSSGLRRINSLDAYAQTLVRLRKLNLKPDVQQRLAPAFSWAGEHPDQGPKLLGTIEHYLSACGRVDARAAATPVALPPREAKLVADAMKAASTQREAFLADAAALSHGPMSADVAGMTQRADAIRQAIDLAETYEKMPKSVATLLAFKPKPGGGLERRVATVMATLADPKPSAAKDDAAKVLADIVKLADLAAELDWPSNISADLARIYTHDRLAVFEGKRRDLVTELAGLIGSNKEMDATKFQRLQQMRSLRAALAEAAVFENAVRRAEPMSRWVDWPVEPADLQAIFAPYREGMAAQFDGYATDANTAGAWGPIHGRYGPMARLVIRGATFADQCAAMPSGMAGHIARLMTPMDVQAFGNERFAAFAARLWSRYEQAGDSRSAALVGDAVAGRVREK